MAKFDVFFTVLEVEHATVSAENEEAAYKKAKAFIDNLVDEGIVDPVSMMSADIDVRPVGDSILNGLE